MAEQFPEQTNNGIVVDVDPGIYRFRYLLDGERWENDWEADDYIDNDHGRQDSVVDLTAPSR